MLSMIVDNSSCIQRFDYDESTKILTITFGHGGKYDYPGIPKSLVERWMKSESKGKFYNKEIRFKYGAAFRWENSRNN